MVIPKGYKRTEIGIIPENWKILKAEQLMTIGTGSRNTEHKTEKGSYPFFVRSQTVEKIDGYNYDCEAVLTAGDGAGTGKVYHYINGKFDVHQRVYVMTDFQSIDGKFFFNYFKENFYDEVCKYTAKSTVDSVRKDMIAKMLIPIPNLPEQKRIAEALSDIDELICNLEKLIAKKKDIKLGAMQELLTGKKRLKGFKDVWVEQTLGELFNFSGGYSASRDMLSTEGHCYLHYGDIHASNKTYIDCDTEYIQIPKLKISLNKISTSALLKDGDVVFVDASEDDEGTNKHIVIRNRNNSPFISGLHTVVAKPKGTEIIHLYREYCFSARYIKQQFLYYAAGTKVAGVSKSNIVKIKIKYPVNHKEQTAIATILSDMDTEISELEKKLAKYTDIKQSMMQELLTGRIRLPETDKAQEAMPKVKAKSTNKHFEEVVVLSAIVALFSSEKYPMGRFRRQKFAYLFERYTKQNIDGFLKKAAGPYNPTIRYKDENIAIKSKYVVDQGKGKFVKGEKSEEAMDYFVKWYGEDAITWINQFKYRKSNDLELLTTVAEAVRELIEADKEPTLLAVKEIIAGNSEWKPKLEKDFFNDNAIQLAIKESIKLFHQ